MLTPSTSPGPAQLGRFIDRMRSVREGEERLAMLLQAQDQSYDPGRDIAAGIIGSHAELTAHPPVARESLRAFARRIGYSVPHVLRLIGYGLPRDKDKRIPIAAALAWLDRYRRVRIHVIARPRVSAKDEGY